MPSVDIHYSYFVDLFVRLSNLLAQYMYANIDYLVYRQVILYYSGEEDAYDMRKALPRDTKKASVVPRKPFKCYPHEIEWS